MAKKSVYFYKVILRDTKDKSELPVSMYGPLFSEIFNVHCVNGSLKLSLDDYEPIIMDVIENNSEYLFARLSRKRPNNSIQKRDYNTFTTSEVLSSAEMATAGVECFTYCIFGYSHGILSVANAKGAPRAEAFSMMLAKYNREIYLETENILNRDTLSELIDGKHPEINRIHIDIAQPDAQVLQSLFGFSDKAVLDEVSRETSSLVIDVRPDFRGRLMNDRTLISTLIGELRKNSSKYNAIKLTGKPDSKGSQYEYDLYEEFFKYQIDIREYRQENGRRIEMDKSFICHEYRGKMMAAYCKYKDMILKLSNR